MKKLTPTQQEYLKAAELFLWAEATDFTFWFTGTRKRWKRTEYNLPRMVRKGVLKTSKSGKKLIYSVSGKGAGDPTGIKHGLICTKALLRFKVSIEGNDGR
jgi:hypothetical protein